MKVSNIVLHCSDSEFGCAREIRQWHLQRGWKDIGYHFVILNGNPVKGFYLPLLDGAIECGRVLDGDGVIAGAEVGSHALGYNDKSVGICLVGTKTFTSSQRGALMLLLKDLIKRYGLTSDAVIGHYETASGKSEGKTCPNFDVAEIRRVAGDAEGLCRPRGISSIKNRQ